MDITEIIVIIAIVLIIGAAVAYIIKAKMSGKGCIGCPDSATCSAKGKKKDTACGGSCHNCHLCTHLTDTAQADGKEESNPTEDA